MSLTLGGNFLLLILVPADVSPTPSMSCVKDRIYLGWRGYLDRTVCCALYIQHSLQSFRAGIITPVSQMRKQAQREQANGRGHGASNWQHWKSRPASPI